MQVHMLRTFMYETGAGVDVVSRALGYPEKPSRYCARVLGLSGSNGRKSSLTFRLEPEFEGEEETDAFEIRRLRVCSKCGRRRFEERFGADASRPDGLARVCKECRTVKR